MARHLVSVLVTKRGTKFSRIYHAEITAPTAAEALRHLQNRCRPGGEYARKWPEAAFSDFQAISLDFDPVTFRMEGAWRT